MKSNPTFFKALTLFLAVFSFTTTAFAAHITVNSTSGSPYSVTISVVPTAIVPAVTSGCGSGYNYTLTYDYSISYTNGAPQGNLYTLQFTFNCGGTVLGPNTVSSTAGSYTNLSTNSQYTSLTNCATATLSSNNCIATLAVTVTGPGIANQTFNLSNPLPLSLISFNGKDVNDKVQLNWSVAGTPRSGYFVERSLDASTWTSLQYLDTKGSSENSFQYTDMQPFQGMNYYRLRSVDLNGEIDYSHTIAVKTFSTQSDINVYPNPSNTDKIRVTGVEDPTNWTLSITNFMAQEVLHTQLKGNEVTLPSVPPGLYFIRITNDISKESKLFKFIKQ